MNKLLKRLESSERALDLHRNVGHDPLLLYKIKKLFRHPYRYTRLILSKWGIAQNAWSHTFFGTSIKLPLSDVNAADLFYAGSLRSRSEGYVTRFLLHHLQPNDVFYDIGANYGFYTSLALSRGAYVHAFEPSPHCLSFLHQTIDSTLYKDRLTLNPNILSDTSGYVAFFDMSLGHKSGMSTIDIEIAKGREMQYRTISVEAITLDMYIHDHKLPTIMKIDTEGSEARVIAGAQHLLKTYTPTIVVELWGDNLGIENSQATLNMLTTLGYKSYAITTDGDLKPVSIDITTIGENNNFVFKKH